MQLIDSKTILAKLMATENLQIEQRNDVTTASFDVENRILVIPVLKQDLSSNLYDLFIGHEVGHALYTPQDGIKEIMEDKTLRMSVVNVVEDARIERKIKNKYPGLRYNFVQGYKELLDMDFFGLSNYTDLNELNFADKLNLYCKGGPMMGIIFTEREKLLVDKVERTESWADVIDVSREILEYMKEQREEKQNQEMFDLDDLEGFDSDNYKNFDTFESEDLDEEKEQDIFNSQSNNKKQGRENKKEDQSNDDSSSNADIDEDLDSVTDMNTQQNSKYVFVNNSTSMRYVNIPDIDTKECVWDYKELYAVYKEDPALNKVVDYEGFLKIQREANPVVSYLVKEFEMHKNAEQMKKARTAKTGDLNMNRVFAYTFSEDIFKKAMIMPDGKNHGLVLFLDWSGSMSSYIGSTMKQLFNLVLFCRKVNIPYEVYAFTNNYLSRTNDPDSKIKPLYYPKPKNGDMALDEGFQLMNILSSRMSSTEFNYAGAALTDMTNAYKKEDPYDNYLKTTSFMALNCTPLNAAIMAAMNLVPEFREKNKLQVVNTVFLTDGVSDMIQRVFIDEVGQSRNFFDAEGYMRNEKTVVRDPKTRYELILEADSKRKPGRSMMTDTLLMMLKHRTGSNTMGFYLLSPHDMKSYSRQMFGSYDYQKSEEARAEFRKNKFVVLYNSGYDEYYLLNTKDLNIDDDDDLEVDSNMTKSSLVRAFSKYATSRVTNRTILNKFIQLIK